MNFIISFPINYMGKHLSGILSKMVGEESNIQPNTNDIKIVWLTVEDVDLGSRKSRKPSIWFYYNTKLYYCVCDSYDFHMFETYDDWENFDSYFPTVKEIDTLFQFNPIFFEVDAGKILNGYLGKYCEFELDFIREYLRESNINKIVD